MVSIQIKEPKKFFEKYLQLSLFLNLFIISTTLVYQIGFTLAYYGWFLGILLLLTFFYDVGLIFLNNKYLNKLDKTGKRLNQLTYVFLIYAILTMWTLISIATYIDSVMDLTILTYRPLYHGLWLFALIISYIDLKNLRKSKSPPFVWEPSENRIKPPSNLKRKLLLMLRGTLVCLGVTTFVFAGLLAFSLLFFGGPPVYGLIINLCIAPFFPLLILTLPLVTLLLYKILAFKFKKASRIIVVTGFSLTFIFTLPFLMTPMALSEIDAQFADVFGEDWNEFEPEISENFLTMQHVLIDAWFGGPSLDADSWKVEEDVTFVKTSEYELKYDVYYPGKTAAKDVGEYSTILFIHGGAWILGDKTLGATYLKRFAAQGYVCFSIEYRLLDMDVSELMKDEAGYNVPLLSDMDMSMMTKEERVGDYTIEDMMIDIANFTQYLAAHEGEEELYGADLDNVFVMGQSAGAHLAGITCFGFNDDISDKHWGFNDSINLIGSILVYPPNSAKRFFYEDHRSFYDAGFTKDKTPKDDPDFYDLYTPSELVDEDDPPCIIFQGTSDSMVPLINAIEIQEACNEEKVDCILAKSYFVGHAHDATGFFYKMTNYYMERFLYLVNND